MSSLNVTSPVPTTMSPQAVAAQQAVLHYLSQRFRLLQVFLLIGYSTMWLLCVLLICYMRYNRNVAFKGDSSAARKIILPAFEPLLWILGFSSGAFSITIAWAITHDWFETAIPAFATECFYAGRQFVMLTVVIYMLQKSVTVPALMRTVIITFVLATYTIVVQRLLAASGIHENGPTKTKHHVVMSFARGALLLVYTYVLIKPPGRASKRTLREYCAFVYVYYASSFTYTQLFNMDILDEGFIMTYVTICWGAMCPLFIWRVLIADTQHWRGMGQRAVALQSLFRQKNHIDERISSQGLHVLIEMHRKYIIDFAYLELKQRIGTGSTSVVFHGVLHSRTPVAIKVYTPSEFNEETVAEFSQEAALCGALHHPNIVHFHGMCVCPPTICLVSELCQGSLDDITLTIASTQQHVNRQQHAIDIAFMLDAARAVAYIHSFSPPFIHRDIKPANFLVDANNTVKLTDFGESRSLPRSHYVVGGSAASSQLASTRGKRYSTASGASLQQHQRHHESIDRASAKMTVKGTVDYMAPEVINGKAGLAQYGEAADVYSLAITMWDILNPGKEKFPTLKNNHLHIFEFVIDGKRPVLSPDVHPALREVIESAWHADPRVRPSAQNIVSILESIQEEMLAVLAGDLSDEIEQDVMCDKYGELITKTFAAQDAIDKMLELGIVRSRAEALRLGNGMMDAGMMHHYKHDHPFEASDAVYFFDDDNIRLNEPILLSHQQDDDDPEDEDDVDVDEYVDHVVPLPGGRRLHTITTATTGAAANALAARRRPSSSSSSAAISTLKRKMSNTSQTTIKKTTISSKSDHALYENGMCNCRKLGQRLEQPKAVGAARRRFKRARQKLGSSNEDNLLTARLLAAEATQGTLQLSEFDGFDSTPFHESTDVVKIV